jgi:hypothetical protein
MLASQEGIFSMNLVGCLVGYLVSLFQEVAVKV